MTPISHEMRMQIAGEVERQMAPMASELRAQSRLIAEIDAWRRGLWGDSSGSPGYLERARREDTERYERLFAAVSDLRADALRAEGREELRKELGAEQVLREKRTTSRLSRVHMALAIAATLGAGLAGGAGIARRLIAAVIKALGVQ